MFGAIRLSTDIEENRLLHEKNIGRTVTHFSDFFIFYKDEENLELWLVNSALMRDPALEEFITAPYGTAIIRVSPDKFEIDKMDKEIFIAHR